MSVKHCPRCPFFSFHFTRVVNHIGLVHSAEPNFRVFCGIGGCASSYTNFHSYRSHLYRQHRDVLAESGSNLQQQLHETAAGGRSSEPPDNICFPPRADFQSSDPYLLEPQESDSTSPRPDVLDSANDDCSGPTSHTQAETSPRERTPSRGFQRFLEQVKSTVWQFFFNVFERHNLPHSVVQSLFKELELVFELVLKAYGAEVVNSVTPEVSPVLEDLLSCMFLNGIFKGLDDKRNREKYAKDNFPFVAPEEVVVGQSDKYHYVPIPKLLNALCQVPDLVAHFTTPLVEKNSEPAVYRDVTDGLVYREHLQEVVPPKSTHTVILLLYTDEIDVVNPIGAKRGVHKILAVYCSLLNLHVKYRSQLQNIYLVMLLRNTYVKIYGMTVLLKPLVDDLKQLHEQGLSFNLAGANKKAEVLVLAFCGDNLSMNRLGGFTCCFSSGRVCRFCMVSAHQLSNQTSEKMCRIRTAATHEVHLQAVSVNGSANKRLYGVNEASPLLQLPYFDATRQLPPDLMHDILEGGMESVLRRVLKALLSAGLLSRRDLDEVSSFHYGPNDVKNKPVPINELFFKSNAGLKGTASSKWCLFRFIPLILGAKIPEGNEDWEVLLKFREIVDIIFAPEIPASRLPYLEVLVQTFLTELTVRYGPTAITPKLHYMVHYARFVREMGPLKHLWAMRFEAKHQYFKKLAATVKNFKNLTFTLSMRHQLKQSHQLCSFELYEGLETKQCKPVVWSAAPKCAKDVLPAAACEVEQASIDRCRFRRGSVLVDKGD